MPIYGLTPIQSERVPQSRPTLGHDTSSPQQANIQGGTECIEKMVTTNKQLTASLARQSLPKCHPDAFTGDATLFHPWKSAFKAMIRDADVSPEQEINYLRQYTRGDPQKLVDSYRKRQYREPASLLNEVWAELERRFGNAAVITNALLKKLDEASKFDEKERDKLQTFSDICSDVDSQLNILPGLACLNYPNSIRPIVEKLPSFLRSKWEKIVAEYAESNHDAYPSFNDFSVMIQKQATLKNHPNVLAGGTPASKDNKQKESQASRSKLRPDAKVFVSNTIPTPEDTNSKPNEEKLCLFHGTKSHNIADCRAFGRKNLAAKTDWLMKARLCFRCLSPNHQSKDCSIAVSCDKCGSNAHNTLLHLEKRKPATEDNGEELKTTCTAICQGKNGGLSCSKIVLVDIFLEERPDVSFRVYAIVDDQSNASMISPHLADKLGASGPREKFLLSTCSAVKEIKFGRRIPGLSVKSATGEQFKLPTLVECDHIPQDKSEIPTPEIARQFPHLKEIADQIPPLNPETDIEILIGRDAPELLKVRASKNGPNGTPLGSETWMDSVRSSMP